MATVIKKITSRQNEIIKSTVKQCLTPSAECFFVEGTKFVTDLPSHSVLSVFTTAPVDFTDFISSLPDIPVYEVSESVMEKLCGAVSLQKICATARKTNKEMPSRLVVLDGVRDPGNAGTVVRTAEAFGYGCIFSDDSVNPFGGKVVRSSAGTVVTAYMERCKLTDRLPELKNAGYTVVSSELDEKAERLENFGTDENKLAVIVGNEGTGVSREVSELADAKLYIPIKNTNSLNAAVAGAIIMHYFAEDFR